MTELRKRLEGATVEQIAARRRLAEPPSEALSGALERRLIRCEPYPLDDFFPTASWVRIACRHARVTVDGKPIPGAPNLSTDSFGRSSTAQINIAEVWTT